MRTLLSPRRLAAALLVLAAAACADRDPLGPDTSTPLPSAPDAAVVSGDWDGMMRIGVVPSATQVDVGAPGAWTATDAATGAVIVSGTGGSVAVTLESGASVRTDYRLQVACTGSASYISNWLAQAASLGYVTYTEPVPAAGCTRLFIGEFPVDASFSVRNAFRNEVIAAGLAGTDSFWKQVTIVQGSNRYRVVGAGVDVTVDGPVVLTSSDGPVTIDGALYRGSAEVLRNSGGALAGVNVVPLEEYLYGVVPRELPPTVFPEVEALKAQAVAARTYALRGLGKRAADGYDLLPTTSDQVYGGLSAEHPVSTQAVDGTEGIVATHNGALIEALYHSTSGGHTADNEEAYNSAPISYLRGVPDSERGRSLEHVPSVAVFKASANPASLRGFRGGDFEADWSRYHRWTFEWTAEEMRQVVSAYAGQDVGRVLAVDVTDRGPSGRALRVEYVTEAGTWVDTKDRIRTSLKFVDAGGSMRSLLSTLFFIEPVVDGSTGEVTGFRAWGGGWGHGVGMSQTGAVGLAEKGATYDRILAHYYQGIALERWDA